MTMARVNLVISDELEEIFRETVFRKYGMRKGNITRAVEEAIRLWIETEKRRRYKDVV